jgi:hypothetical protein
VTATEQPALPEIATLAEFAGLARYRQSYVTQLRRDGRLVLTEDGKRVRVAESFALIEQTRDPSRAGVAARHAAGRANQATGEGAGGVPAPAPAPAAPQADPGDAGGEDPGEPEGKGYQYWRERNERAKALASERENAVAEGRLLQAAEVEAQVASAATTLRTRLEALPSTLGPQLAAATDEGQVIATLAETIEHVLEELSRQFAAIASQQGKTE